MAAGRFIKTIRKNDKPRIILLLTFTLLVLLFSALLCVMFWSRPSVQKYICLAGTATFLVLAAMLLYDVRRHGILTLQVGNWPAPFGITLVADLFSAIMVLITAIIGLTTLVYGLEDVNAERKSKGFYPIFLFLLFGVCGSFLAGDVFNLFVWFEVMLVSSFVLISLGSTKAQLEGSVKYVILNFIASGFFLTGIGILYKATGALNMAELALIIREQDTNSGLITLSAIFFFMSFGIKSAVFPLFAWLPASYHTPPVSVSGLMAGLLTKVGVYTLIRFFSMIFIQEMAFTHTLLLIVAAFTMVSGVLGAMAQNEFRKVLSFHIVSQIGYMVMGLAIFTPLALAGAVFYIIHHIVVKTNLFLISGIAKTVNGHYLLNRGGGMYDRFPLIAGLFVISAFSLAGIPPLSGFWGKFILARAGLEAGQVAIVVVSLAVGLLTLYSMVKIWTSVFWANDTEKKDHLAAEAPFTQKSLLQKKYLMVLPVAALASITLFLGLNPDFLVSLSTDIATQLLNPEEYIKAVLNP